MLGFREFRERNSSKKCPERADLAVDEKVQASLFSLLSLSESVNFHHCLIYCLGERKPTDPILAALERKRSSDITCTVPPSPPSPELKGSSSPPSALELDLATSHCS